MLRLTILCVALASCLAKVESDVTKLQIGVKHRPKECTQRAKIGDKLKIHYTGKLTNGEVFDSSVERDTPFEFTLGKGQVIKGWDQGILNMCVGEKRKLKIPADMGYGERGSPPKIPGGATLIFETELMEILPATEESIPDYLGGAGGAENGIDLDDDYY